MFLKKIVFNLNTKLPLFSQCKFLNSNISPAPINSGSFSINDLKQTINRLSDSRKFPVKIETKYLDRKTIGRISLCSDDFLMNLVKNLSDHGIRDKQLVNTLKTHDDWSLLTRDKINELCEIFRSLSMKPEVFSHLISLNQSFIYTNNLKAKLENRLLDLKDFFTKKQVEFALIKSPYILIDNLDNFRYKFTYIYVLMGIKQDEMCHSGVFNYSIDYIRERHLFLSRSGFYDKPNKKNLTKVENPLLRIIMDSEINEYLRICTKSKFNKTDYDTFCEYLKEEDFDSELLGYHIGRSLQNQIVKSIRTDKRSKNLEDNDDDDE